MTWFIYIIRTRDNTLYTGITTDPQRRFQEHCANKAKTAKYLRAHSPESLDFFQPIGTRSLALKVEYALKHLSRNKKELIIKKKSFDFDEENGKIL